MLCEYENLILTKYDPENSQYFSQNEEDITNYLNQLVSNIRMQFSLFKIIKQYEKTIALYTHNIQNKNKIT